jgi:hypothetical protein
MAGLPTIMSNVANNRMTIDVVGRLAQLIGPAFPHRLGGDLPNGCPGGPDASEGR